ncbi:MAG: futA1 1 [Dehalococcoidia bacterium]|nr:futA1 1 [Dehalococcoidia bacterium]
MEKKWHSVLALVVVTGLLLSACAAPKSPAPAPAPAPSSAAATPAAPKPGATREQQLIEAIKAAGEKEVVFWTLSWYSGPVEQAFEAKYPFLKLKAVDMSAELEPRLVEEYKAGRYNPDVVMVPLYRAVRLQSAGILQEYPFPNWPNTWPGQPKHNFWRNTQDSLRLPMYNTDRVAPADVPKSWQDLDNAKWRGRSIISTSAGSWIIGYAYELGDLTKEGAKWDRTVSFWKKVVETTRPRVGTGFKGPLDLVVVGDVDIMLVSAATTGLYNIRRGAPVDFAPLKTTTADPWSVALPKFPPHPNAAQLLIDFLTSEEGVIAADIFPNPTRHPNMMKKAIANQYYAGKGTQIIYVPDELAPEAMYPEADNIWIRDVIGRR